MMPGDKLSPGRGRGALTIPCSAVPTRVMLNEVKRLGSNPQKCAKNEILRLRLQHDKGWTPMGT